MNKFEIEFAIYKESIFISVYIYIYIYEYMEKCNVMCCFLLSIVVSTFSYIQPQFRRPIPHSAFHFTLQTFRMCHFN